MTVETYTVSGSLKRALTAFHTAENKVEQASLNVAKALYNERESIATVGRRAIAESAGVSESRISQWRATGDAIARGISEEALLVVNRGTGNAKGRVTSRVLREALAAVDNGKADAEEASKWILANALPGDESESEDVETEESDGADGADGAESDEDVTPLDKAINTLARLLKAEDDTCAATHDALVAIAVEVIDGAGRKAFAANLAKSILSA